jgi:hypothetical protein
MLKLKKIRPMFNQLVTTMDRYDMDQVENGVIIKPAGSIKEYQTVLSIGSTVRDIKVGDKVLIDPTRYGVKKHQEGSLKDGVITDNPVIKYNFNVVNINDSPCLIIYDQDVDFIIEEYEETRDRLILPKKKKIIA